MSTLNGVPLMTTLLMGVGGLTPGVTVSNCRMFDVIIDDGGTYTPTWDAKLGERRLVIYLLGGGCDECSLVAPLDYKVEPPKIVNVTESWSEATVVVEGNVDGCCSISCNCLGSDCITEAMLHGETASDKFVLDCVYFVPLKTPAYI